MGEASRFDTGEGAGFIIVRSIAADADSADGQPVVTLDQDTSSRRNEPPARSSD
jgi:hypothetical protein